MELRKAKKDEQLQKRRNLTVLDEPTSPLQENVKSPPQAKLMNIEDIVAGMSLVIGWLYSVLVIGLHDPVCCSDAEF